MMVSTMLYLRRNRIEFMNTLETVAKKRTLRDMIQSR